MSLVALVFWPAAVASAVRIAKPHSLWARLFYRDAQARSAAASATGTPARARQRLAEASAGSSD